MLDYASLKAEVDSKTSLTVLLFCSSRGDRNCRMFAGLGRSCSHASANVILWKLRRKTFILFLWCNKNNVIRSHLMNVFSI